MPSFPVVVLAQSMQYGSQGNIAPYDINTTYTATIFAKNTTRFTGGQNVRNFPTVSKTDIARLTKVLTPNLTQSMSGALQSQLTPNEALFLFPCDPTITPDHKEGEEAATIKVTVLEICSGLAYDKQDLQIRAANLLTSRLRSQFGVGYNLLQPVTATITNVALQKNIVTFSLFYQATSIYQFSRLQQTQIKQEIAGKSTDEALGLLLHNTGIQTAFIDGVDKEAALPGNINSITITILHPFSE